MPTTEARPACVICDEPLYVRWRDHHGIGGCGRCGCTYRVFHYDDDGNRVEKPPTCMIREEWRPVLRRYWKETRRNVDPGSFKLGVSKRDRDDHEALTAWLDAHPDLVPADPELED